MPMLTRPLPTRQEAEPAFSVTVIVVTWNGAHLLRPCLDSLRAQTMPHAVLVIDNASTDGTDALLEDYPEVWVAKLTDNRGFAGGADLGLRLASTPYVALLNNDAVADPGWLAAVVGELEADPELAATTPRVLLAADGMVNNAGGALTRYGCGYDRGYGKVDDDTFRRPVDVAAFCGNGAALRREVALGVGGFPTSFFLYYEDTDLSWRLGRAGWRIRYVPQARVEHLHSASSDQRSASFAYYNQRNQLLTVLRNAPARVVLRAFVRFIVVTVVRAAARNDTAVYSRPGHRLRVLAAVIRRSPAALRERRRSQRSAAVSRRSFAKRWLGTEAR
jgi:hypothetical protein